jgi:hypothetical protein
MQVNFQICAQTHSNHLVCRVGANEITQATPTYFWDCFWGNILTFEF